MAERMTALVTLTEHTHDDGVLVRLRGRLDRRSVADVRLDLHRLVAPGRPPVLLDLADSVIGDATALGLLVEVHRRAQRHGVPVRVVAADARSYRLLLRVRLHHLLAPSTRTTRVLTATS